MRNASRIILGVVSLLSILMALRFWDAPLMIGAQLGVAPAEGAQALGQATIRADFPAFFGVWGALCLLGLVRNKRSYFVVPIALTAVALAGRILNLTLEGVGPGTIAPMVVEASAVAAAVFAYVMLGERGGA